MTKEYRARWMVGDRVVQESRSVPLPRALELLEEMRPPRRLDPGERPMIIEREVSEWRELPEGGEL